MESLITNLNDLFLNWPLIVYVLGLNVLGKIIKHSPIENKYIPSILAVVGGATCHFVVEKLPVWSFFNTMTHVWFGVFIGYGAVGIHQQLANLEVIKRIPFLSKILSDENDSTPTR